MKLNRIALVALFGFLLQCQAQIQTCTDDNDCTNGYGLCVDATACSCLSGFSGANCQTLPPPTCDGSRADVLTTGTSFYGDVDLEYLGGSLTMTFFAPYEESIFTDPSGTPTANNDAPYALYTTITFGGGANDDACAYPTGSDVAWTVSFDSTTCEDKYSVTLDFASEARGLCGWNNDDLLLPRKYSKPVTISRRYYLGDDNDGVAQYRTESSTKIISVTFPEPIILTRSVSVNAPINVLSFVTGVSYSPDTNKWTVTIRTNVQSPYVLAYDSFDGLGDLEDRLAGGAPVDPTPVTDNCQTSGSSCTQDLTFEFTGCEALVTEPSFNVTYLIDCRDDHNNCPYDGEIDTAVVTIVLETSSSCPSNENVTIDSATMQTFMDADLTQPGNDFLSSETLYFAIDITSTGDVPNKAGTQILRVCVQAADPQDSKCNDDAGLYPVQFTVMPDPTDPHTKAFSMPGSQFLDPNYGFQTNGDVDEYVIAATVLVQWEGETKRGILEEVTFTARRNGVSLRSSEAVETDTRVSVRPRFPEQTNVITEEANDENSAAHSNQAILALMVLAIIIISLF